MSDDVINKNEEVQGNIIDGILISNEETSQFDEANDDRALSPNFESTNGGGSSVHLNDPNNEFSQSPKRSEQNNSESSKKRKYDDQSNSKNSNNNNNNNNNNNKRSNTKSTNDSEVYLKLMVPSSAAGGVIGRGGEKIAQIQKDANVKMKMSKTNDYYPNTNERVCLIIGSVNSVLKAHDYIMERVLEKPESSKSQSIDEDRMNQIKIVIPNTTAGLLIGRAGAYIKQIKDESGAFVQISTKQTDLPERIVTIEGDTEKRNKALSLVVKKIADDPQHNSMTNLNYSSSNSSSNDSYSGGQSMSNLNNNQLIGQGNKFDFNSAANYLAGLNNLALLIINCGGSSQMTSDSLKVALRSTGYSSSATMEIIEAITVLMSYGLITKMQPQGFNNLGIANLANLANLASVSGFGGLLNNSNNMGGGQQHGNHNSSQHNHGNSNNNSGYGSNAANLGNVLQILSSSLAKR